MKATKEQRDYLREFAATHACERIGVVLAIVLDDYERLLSAEAGGGAKPRLGEWQEVKRPPFETYYRRTAGSFNGAEVMCDGEWTVFNGHGDDWREGPKGIAPDLLSAQAAADAAAALYYQIDDPVTLPSGDAR